MQIAQLHQDGTVIKLDLSDKHDLVNKLAQIANNKQACLFFAGFGQSAEALSFLLLQYRSYLRALNHEHSSNQNTLTTQTDLLADPFLAQLTQLQNRGDLKLEQELNSLAKGDLNNAEDIYLFYAYDGSELATDVTVFFEQYEQVRLVAWSYGVKVACSLLNDFLAKLPNPDENQYVKLVDFTTIAGTAYAIDPKYGINERIHKLTTRALNEDNLKVFMLKMFASSSEELKQLQTLSEEHKSNSLEHFLHLSCLHRSIYSLKQELNSLLSLKLASNFQIPLIDHSIAKIDQSYICEQDLIFPVAAQKQYFNDYNLSLGSNVCQIKCFDLAHLPLALINKCLFGAKSE